MIGAPSPWACSELGRGQIQASSNNTTICPSPYPEVLRPRAVALHNFSCPVVYLGEACPTLHGGLDMLIQHPKPGRSNPPGQFGLGRA